MVVSSSSAAPDEPPRVSGIRGAVQFDPLRITMIIETLAHPARYTGALLHFAQRHPARVRCELAPVESAHYLSTVQFVKYRLRCVTLCGHEAVLLS